MKRALPGIGIKESFAFSEKHSTKPLAFITTISTTGLSRIRDQRIRLRKTYTVLAPWQMKATSGAPSPLKSPAMISRGLYAARVVFLNRVIAITYGPNE